MPGFFFKLFHHLRTMKVAIVAATVFEIEPFMLQYPEAEIIITGVGVPATIFSITKKLLIGNFNFAVQAGIGGTFHDEGWLSKVFAIKKDCFADIGFVEKGNFKTSFEYGFADPNEAPFEGGWLHNSETVNLPLATAVTVNKVTDNQFDIDLIRNKFSPDIESMEGAGFHYACLQAGIKFLQLRAVSNIVGDRNKANWKMQDAIANLNEALSETYKKLLAR